jgi:outer membrane protein TolC
MKFHCLAAWSLALLVSATQADEPAKEKGSGAALPPPRAVPEQPTFPEPISILSRQLEPIDLASALQLAGVQNPEILLARQHVVEAAALRQLAAAQFLPSLNVGTNVDVHDGTLQRSTGQIIKVDRSALYLGLGAGAVGAGTVNVPGIVWNANVSQTIFGALVRHQQVRQSEFASQVVRNDMLLRVAGTYIELLRAEGHRAVLVRTRDDAREVARITANYARTGQGRQADADRAATELDQRNTELLQAEGDVLAAGARLAQLLNLDPSVRLHVTDGWAVPAPIVPDPVPLPELIAIALVQRPELRERQAAIRAAFLELRNAQVLPFSPNVLLGYSAGTFGGGSDLVSSGIVQANGTILQQPRFDSFAPRQDIDGVIYWTLRNLGVGNLALARLGQSNLRSERLRELETLDRVRAEVAEAYARTHARYAQIETNERAVATSQRAFKEDLTRTQNQQGLPIEVLDSLRLLGRSRLAYLDAILDYNRAQFELYVALGQPPANTLAHRVPAELVPPESHQPAPPP